MIHQCSIRLDDSIEVIIPKIIARIKNLEATGMKIQIQPLGFLRIPLEGQLNADNGLFLHLWSPSLRRQTGGPYIHTHVFDMRSKILLGTVIDKQYQALIDSNGNFQLITGACRQTTCSLIASEGRANLAITSERTHKPGDLYQLPKETFHITEIPANDVAVTLMEKSAIDAKDPILAVPIEQGIPSEVFDRENVCQAAAWDLTYELLNLALVRLAAQGGFSTLNRCP